MDPSGNQHPSRELHDWPNEVGDLRRAFGRCGHRPVDLSESSPSVSQKRRRSKFPMRALLAVALSLAGTSALSAQRVVPAPPAVVALAGDWELNLARTHYGPGVDRRRSERFSCTLQANRLSCVIRSVRADGRQLTGRFVAPMDGTSARVTGIPDVDAIQLRRPSSALLDATFLLRGQPVFGYRAFQSQDARSLMIVSVDPVSRVTLTTVVIYDRRTGNP